jgi:hypothetical protein
MQTATRQDDIKVLKRLLQQRLQEQAALEVPFQVQCGIQDGNLLILVQHEASGTSDASSIFDTLQKTLYALQPAIPKVAEGNQPVHLFLRIAGQKQPYAVDGFTIDTSAIPAEDDQPGDRQTPWNSPSSRIDPPARGKQTNPYLADSEPLEDDELLDDEEYEYEEDLSSTQAESPSVKPPRQPRQKISLPVIATSLGVAGVLSLGVAYAVSRPCVVGACPQLQMAQQLNQESLLIQQKAQSGQELGNAKQQLENANQQIESIPPWSRHYTTAQKLLQTYERQAVQVDGVLGALGKATQATLQSQNPPLTANEWKKVLELWQDAIAGLRLVPPTNPMYRMAQQRLRDYQLNVAIVNQRIRTEQQADGQLAEAKQTAQTAETRMNSARSFENWQQVFNSWQTALNALATIPPTTTAYKEARDLLLAYQPKFATARERRAREQISANNYNQAVNLAGLAKRLEQQNQWSQALASWRQASNLAQQVPNGSFYYAQTQPLIDAYANAQKQAETNLRVSLVLQRTRMDLNRTCSSDPRICNFTVTTSGISVYLTPAWYNQVLRTGTSADRNGDYNTTTALQDHLETLQMALQTISENANLPLILYDHRRQVIGTYSPKR